MLNKASAWTIASVICVFFTIFNLLTLLVIVKTKQLRRKVCSYPIGSFLIASALQGFTAAPLYIFKKIAYPGDVPMWLCDVSRFTYIYCGHLMKVSLLLVSFDRLLAVSQPFHYQRLLNVRRISGVISGCWLVTLVTDTLPFYARVQENCGYVPTRGWGIGVIVAFNIVPLIIITVNYTAIWTIAARMRFHDNHLMACRKSKLVVVLEMKATKRSLVLLCVYVVCWGPKGVFYIYDHFCTNCLSSRHDLDTLKAAIKILSYTSSVFAPVCYCWWNKEYLQAAKHLLFPSRKHAESVVRSRATTALSLLSSSHVGDSRLLQENVQHDKLLVGTQQLYNKV